MENKLFLALKEEMSETIKQLDVDNIESSKEKVIKYFSLADVILTTLSGQEDINIHKEEVGKSRAVAVVEEKISEPSIIDTLADSFEAEKEIKGFPLERKLVGGFLSTGLTTDNIFVPESIIKQKGFEDGDIVSAEPIPSKNPYKKLYDFELVEKAKENYSPVKRESMEFGVVKYDNELSKYYIENDIHDNNLKVDEHISRFMISTTDEAQFDVKEGDVLDISWYQDNFNKGRVVWKYKTDELPKAPNFSKKKLAYKETNTSPKEAPEEIPQTLTGKIICLVGVEPYHAEYKKLIESHGGSFIGLTSETKKVTMTANIKKSDLVMVGISHTSHAASQYANKKAKENNIPFKAFSGYGKGNFLATVYNSLGIMNKGE